MGLKLFGNSICKCSNVISKGDPSPDNFIIKKIKQINNSVVVEINYPNCTNYEGNKILVFNNHKHSDILNSKSIDPHFCDNNHLSPVARFEPTERGWNWAMEFAERI